MGLIDIARFLPDRRIKFIKENRDYRLFAIKRHGSQMYDVNLPYCYHLAMVELYLEEFNYNHDDYKAAAWMHDLVEDTKTSVSDINKLFGDRITALVWACTGEGANRKERNASIHKKLAAYPDAVPVKVGDRLSNISHGIITNNIPKLEMYNKEWPEFKENLEPLMKTRNDQLFWSALNTVMTNVSKGLKNE